MRAYSHGRPRRSYLAGVLAVFLLCSPVAALKMMFTLRFTGAQPGGSCIGAKLKLQRKSTSQPIEVTRPRAFRKELSACVAASVDWELRDLASRSEGSAHAVHRPEQGLLMPAYLQFFLPSTPQNPVFPPAEPVPLAS